MPWRIRKPYIIMNGQRRTMPNEPPKRLPWCDLCDTLAANSAPLYTEKRPDRWWQWFSFSKFDCEEGLSACGFTRTAAGLVGRASWRDSASGSRVPVAVRIAGDQPLEAVRLPFRS